MFLKGIIQFCGDSVAQSVEIFYNKHQQHSLKRTLIQTSIGLFWQVLCLFYKI